MRFGLLGKTLGHSYSPQIHEHLGSVPYCLFEKQPEELEDFLLHGSFDGLNVTIPYKKEVIPYCSKLTPTAQALGSVNTIVRQQDGTLLGHNTDFYGFSSMLGSTGLCVSGKKALVLGSGGASATVVAALTQQGANVVVISRTGEDNYTNLQKHADAALIVNATPVGMYPNVGISPVELSYFPKLEGVLDLIYNPSKTKLLLDAEARGLVAENGLWMLVAQAKESAQYFLGRTIPDAMISHIYRKLRFQMENVILIGMPGCGKTTIGRLLSEKTGRQFVDADSKVSEYAGMSIPDIFAQRGEEGFREIETAVLSDLCKGSGLIIATGGGCVTREENYPLLHQNGRLFWLTRAIDSLPTEGRPLSQAGSLERMYEIRKPLYERFADYQIDNTQDPQMAVQAILDTEARI